MNHYNCIRTTIVRDQYNEFLLQFGLANTKTPASEYPVLRHNINVYNARLVSKIYETTTTKSTYAVVFFGQELQTQVPVLQLSHFETSPPHPHTEVSFLVLVFFEQSLQTQVPDVQLAHLETSPPQPQVLLSTFLDSFTPLLFGQEEQIH